MKMGKAALITPAYISFAWTLMISYQFFTETAVKTVINEILVQWPQIGGWLVNRIDTLVFIYAFSWVFVLSSVIPTLILGKERGMFIQFLVVLAVTVPVFIIQDVLATCTGLEVDQIFNLAVFLNNPLDAASFLFLPYIVIVLIDVFGWANKHRRS
jgi:hypothetical protein